MKTEKVPLYTAAGAVYPLSESMKTSFTAMSRFDEEYSAYWEFSENGHPRIMVPRTMAPLGEDRREEGLAISCKSLFKARSLAQDGFVKHVIALLKSGDSFIAQAPTGFGKTFVGCAAAAAVGRRTMVITTKEDIINQWRDAAKAVMGLDDSQIGLIKADECSSDGRPFVIGLVHSVLKGPARYGAAAFAGFGLVIVDEVHRMGADQFTKAMWHFPAKLRLGLSATPYRKDGKDQVFLGHIGGIKATVTTDVMVPRVLLANSGWRLPRVIREGKVAQIFHSPGKVMHVLKPMGRNTERNALIAHLTVAAYKKKRSTIVFSERMEHLHMLKVAFVSAGVQECDIGYYVGLDAYEGKKADRQAQREKAKVQPVILATYKMASEATDIPWLDTCVLTTPRSDVVQIVGRIRREYEDKKEPVVIDIVDSDSPVFDGYYKNRLKWYNSIGANVKVVA